MARATTSRLTAMIGSAVSAEVASSSLPEQGAQVDLNALVDVRRDPAALPEGVPILAFLAL